MRRIAAAVALAAFGLFASAANAAPQYRIISEDGASDALRVAVRLEARQHEADLRLVADEVRSRLPAQKHVRSVVFFLPFMDISGPAWAEVKLVPAAAVTISGLRLEEEVAFRREASADTRALIGVWLTSPPALAGRMTLYRDGRGKTFAEWQLRSGEKTTDEVSEARSNRGRRYEIAASKGGYYQIVSGGMLELGNAGTVIAVAEPLQLLPATKAMPATSASATLELAKPGAPPKAAGEAAIAAAAPAVIPTKLPDQALKPKARHAALVRAQPAPGVNRRADAFNGDTISQALSR